MRKKNQEELHELYLDPGIVACIKMQMLRMLGARSANRPRERERERASGILLQERVQDNKNLRKPYNAEI